MSEGCETSEKACNQIFRIKNLLEMFESKSSSSCISESKSSLTESIKSSRKNHLSSFMIADILNIKNGIRPKSTLKPDEILVAVRTGNIEWLNKKLPLIPTLEDTIKKDDGSIYFRKRYVCCYTGCGKVCQRKVHMKSHLYRHCDLKQFKCMFEECNKSYIRKDELHRHIKSHLGERKFTCGCGRKFLRSDHLKMHRLKSCHVEKNFN
uniref:Transcription factor Sp5 (Trinotate prediction) n=1 Tax=Henneguya salminicola TaxID=69463 RepID=A0A6G3MI88_HENSL